MSVVFGEPSSSANLLKALDYSVLQQCMHCGMCLPTCPTYVLTLKERHSPRGRIALMRAIADERMELTSEFGREMYYCLGCLACETACPAGVDYTHMFETARAEAERQGVLRRGFWGLVRFVLLRGLFFHQGALRGLAFWLRWYQRLGFQTWFRKSGLTRFLPGRLRVLEPLTPRVSPVHSDRLIRELEEPPGTSRGKVMLLTGCVQDVLFSEVNRATADVLLINGFTVWTPRAQGCCGSLHGHNGELEMARMRARELLDCALPPDRESDWPDFIISNAAGCGSHLKHYGRLLQADDHYRLRAREWDRRVRDINEFLVEQAVRPPRACGSSDAPGQVLTYHEACHLVHGQKIREQPRQLLRMLPGYRLVELPESAWCCGSAGVYNITQPETAAELLQRKLECIARVKPAVIATSNPGCLVQIISGLESRGWSVRAVHPVVLLAEAYARERETP